MVELEIILGALPFVVVLAAIVIASLRDPSVRRNVVVVRPDLYIIRKAVTRKNLVRENGAWWYSVDGSRYAAIGPEYKFHYRMVRSLGLRQYLGLQRIYLEGNPSPYLFEENARMAVLRDTGRLLGNASDSDLPTRLLRPRRMDLVVLVLVGIVGLLVGLVAGRTL